MHENIFKYYISIIEIPFNVFFLVFKKVLKYKQTIASENVTSISFKCFVDVHGFGKTCAVPKEVSKKAKINISRYSNLSAENQKNSSEILNY